jgi:CRISPR/Cas system-associated exonuclease Cas4 (RecB family)
MRIFEHKQFELKELETETIDGKRHYVTPNGKYPSITSVLSVLSKDGIIAWRKRVGEKEANRISTQAARRGTNVHQMCEDYLNNELDQKSFLPHERDMFYPLQKALDKSIGTVYAQEAPLYSDYLGLAGRVDCVAEWDGRLSIVDFKTSRKLKKKEWITNYFQQATAYAIMWEERTGIPIDKLVIAITVEDEDEPQIFVEKRDNWVKDLINTINIYKGQS